MFGSQMADRTSRSRDDNAFYAPGYASRERGTDKRFVRGGSMLVHAATHPRLTALTLGGRHSRGQARSDNVGRSAQ